MIEKQHAGLFTLWIIRGKLKTGLDYYLSKFYIEIKGSKCKHFCF
jgi:hypothetical protein